MVTHPSLSGVETALRVRATNKQGREPERQKTSALIPPTLSLSLGYMWTVLGLAMSALEAVGVWQICHEVREGRTWRKDGLYALLMAVVSLGGREELLLLETFLFPKDNILDDLD